MVENLAYRLESDKPFDTVVASLEKEAVGNQFRVLHVHDVKATLEEKGFEREPLKIVEVCNAGFAYQALQKDLHAALFMPCRFVVHTEGDKTVVTLARPAAIAEMLPGSGLDQLAADVESTLKKVMEASV
ncbi:MAG: DUF302 domain-containing protein [Candidatus Zixiibacteriota bacterium]|nr:MAG: DUF302 domain-containing protein [candidate division Zixibacteria bacterium]